MGTSFGWGDDSAPVSNSITGGSRGRSAASNAPYATQHAVPAAVGCSVADLVPGATVMYSIKPGADEVEAIVVEIESAQGRRDNIRVRFNDGRERQTSEIRLRVVALPQAEPMDENRAPEPFYEDYRDEQQQQQTMHYSEAGPEYGAPLQEQQQPYQANQQPASPQMAPQKIMTPQASPARIQQQQRHSPAHNASYENAGHERVSTGFGDSGHASVKITHLPGGACAMGSSFGWGDDRPSTSKKGDFVDNRIGAGLLDNRIGAGVPAMASPIRSPGKRQDFAETRIGAGVEQMALKPVKGAGTGELAVGQIVLYKQTPRSEAVPVKVVDVELPSTNGAMRTKTYYNVCFEDGRMRQTTIANLTVPPTY